MSQRLPVRPVRLVRKLHSQMRTELERTLDPPRLERSCDDLPVGRSFAETKLGNRKSDDLDDVLPPERCEPAIVEQRLGVLVELNVVLTQSGEQLRSAHAADADCAWP